MKKIFTVLVALIPFLSQGQSKFEPALVFIENFCKEPDIVAHTKFTNGFNAENLRFIRSQNTLSSQWTSAFCDCELCHSIDTDTADFYIAKGESCDMSAHFYPADKKGLGVMQVKVFVPSDPSNFIMGEFRASCWGASTVFIEKENLKVSPNPAGSELNVQFGSGESYQLEILSVDGKVFLQQNISGLNHYLNISALKNGMYIAKVNSGGKVFYTKFIKF